MANPLKAEVAVPGVDVAGFETGATIVLDFNALCALEDELGRKIEEIGAGALQSPGMMRTVFRIALELHHGAVAERDVGDIIQAIGVDKASELVLKAFTLSFPEAAKSTGNPPMTPETKPAKKDGTGRGASRRGAK